MTTHNVEERLHGDKEKNGPTDSLPGWWVSADRIEER